MESFFWMVGVVLVVSIVLVAVARLALMVQRNRQAKRFKDLERDMDRESL